ncbi:MAG TPA: YihY/virulence factor BrkB family protein [Acidimicrobiia bacterium]|jgi:membrane protein|nr:YihY/virulence factor BrkB family protein [Acidimicrobiia bacterium]
MHSDGRSGVVRRLIRIFVSAGKDWLDDKAPRLAAALSYYTAFSLPPLLVLLVGIGGLVLGTDLVQERLMNQIGQLVGDDSAVLLDEAVREAQSTGTGAAVVVGVGALLLGATGVFGQLQDALNTIWEASPKKAGGMWGLIRSRLLSLAAVFGTAFLLLVSLAVSAAIGGIIDMAGEIDTLEPFLVVIDLITSTAMITVLFALMFKFLPDVEIAWRDVWFGAFVTAVLFVIGKFGIGLYLSMSDVGSAYGAAGSLIIILAWIYYSALILFFGAELTQAWATEQGRSPNSKK